MAYGKQKNGVALGSLDLLEPQGQFEILAITAQALEGTGSSQRQSAKVLPHYSFDMVIMNPPYTRATTHEGNLQGIPNPMFAAFGSSEEEQRLMSEATKRLTKGTSAHGNAGEASIFLVLAYRKLRFDGTLALVMPLTLISGFSWENSRRLLAKNFKDLIVVTIAGVDGTEMSFSADTGMGECLIIGKKSENGSKRATFIILNETPAYPMLGATVAEQVHSLITEQQILRLEDGPVGGSAIKFGEKIVGRAIDAPLPDTGGWNLARIIDISLAQSAYQLASKNQIWLPSQSSSIEVPVATVGEIGKLGPYHLDIRLSKNTNGSIRGPFKLNSLQPSSVPTYPLLWTHDADRERTMVFSADTEGTPYKAKTTNEQEIINSKVERVWSTASHCHSNLDFQFNSQSTAMQFTPHKAIGGRAWLSIQLPTVDYEKALVLWANTTFGLLMFWWHASKQQSGRGIIGKSTLHTMPVLDVTALQPGQLAEAVKLFDAMSDKPLKPVNEIAEDSIRRELDEKFVRDVLGLPESIFDPLDLLRRKLGQEPSIRGSK